MPIAIMNKNSIIYYHHEPSDILLRRRFIIATTKARVFYQDNPCDHLSFSDLVRYILLELYLIFCLRELGDLLHSVFRYSLLPSCMIILLNYMLLYIILNNLSIPPSRDNQIQYKDVIQADKNNIFAIGQNTNAWLHIQDRYRQYRFRLDNLFLKIITGG